MTYNFTFTPRKTKSTIVYLVFMLFLILSTLHLHGANITSAGTGNWSASAWPNTLRTGNITTSTTSTTIIGSGTKFLTEISIGNIIKTTGDIVIGTVLSITDDAHLTLTGKAVSNNSAKVYHTQGIGSSDNVTIAGGCIVTLDVNAVCTSLLINNNTVGTATLTFLGTNSSLTILGTLSLGSNGQPKTGVLDMTNGGTLTCRGLNTGNSSSNTFTPGIGTVVLTANNTLPSSVFTSFYNLTINGGTTTASTALIIKGNLTITSGIFAAGSYSHSINGNFIFNGGSLTSTGTINFNGSIAQTIGGSNSPTFYKLKINNTSSTGVSMIKPVSITNQLILSNGILNTNATNILVLGTNAGVSTDGINTEAGSSISFVNGPMSKTGTTAFMFPIGNVSGKNSVWAPVGIAAAASSTITAKYNYSAPANYSTSCTPSTLYQASSVEYWVLSSNNATPAVTLYWENSSRSGIVVPSDVVVAQYNGSCWASLGGSGVAIGNTGSVTGSGFTNNEPITFGTKNMDNPLPIELLSFNATCGSNGVDVTWTTATELNNDYFTIERSLDATNWQVVKTMKGAGNSNMIFNYTTTDENSLQGVSYYRLKQTDFDGKSETFSPVSVSCSTGTNQALVSYYPNPVTTDLSVDVKNISSDNGIVNIYDLTGNKVFSKTINHDELESQKFSMNLSNLATGIYTIVFQTDTFSTSRKIVKN